MTILAISATIFQPFDAGAPTAPPPVQLPRPPTLPVDPDAGTLIILFPPEG